VTTVAVIQARLQSSRFPGKHLAPLAGKPMILHVIRACQRAQRVDKVIVAMSDHMTCDPLYQYIKNHTQVGFYRGSLSNPLERTYEAARGAEATTVVRITADCPLVDYRLIDQVVGFLDGNYNGLTNSPDGTDVEAFTFNVLEFAQMQATTAEREHTTTFIRKLAGSRSVESHPDYADVHYSVNTVEDLHLCERLYAMCGEGARWQDHVDAYRKIKSA
jgi:spore coat polysaccharide biosynthesis protein SpsF